MRPDIVFVTRRVAVFVDGCFWHSCPTHAASPRRNADYWVPKLKRNVTRDKADDHALKGGGWQVIRVWEHESIGVAVAAVEEALAALAQS